MNNIKLYVILLTVLGTLASSVMFLIIKYLSSDLNTYMIAFFRAFIGLIILSPIIIRSKINIFKTKNLKIHILRGVINSLTMLLTFTGISLIALEKAAALTFAVPLYATILSIIILKEVIKIHRTIGLVFGFIGILIVLRPGFIELEIGSLIIITATFVFAFVIIIVKYLTRTDSVITIMTYGLSIISPILFVIALFNWQTPDFTQSILLVCIALCGTLVMFCSNKALELAETSFVMPFRFTKLIWTSIIGYTIFLEIPDIWTWIGGMIVILSVSYIAYRDSLNKSEKKFKEDLQN